MTGSIFRPEAQERAWSSEQIDQVQQIVPLRAWIGLGALVALLIVVLAWGSLGSITIEIRAEGVLQAAASPGEEGDAATQADNTMVGPGRTSGPLHAVIFLPLEERIGIQAGMASRVLPRGLNAYRYGEMLGAVAAVRSVPASRSRLAAVLGDPGLVNRTMRAGPLYEVDVELQTDPVAPSGYAWSSSRGPDVQLAGGTLVNAAILLERKRPFALFSPEATP